VAHFQNQVAGALSQRDEALLEAEQAGEQCEKARFEAGQARERCEKAQEERNRAVGELAELKAEVERFLHEGGEEREGKERGGNGKESGEGEGADVRGLSEEPYTVGQRGTSLEGAQAENRNDDGCGGGEAEEVTDLWEEDGDSRSSEEDQEDASGMRRDGVPADVSSDDAERQRLQKPVELLDVQVHSLCEENEKLREVAGSRRESYEIEMHVDEAGPNRPVTERTPGLEGSKQEIERTSEGERAQVKEVGDETGSGKGEVQVLSDRVAELEAEVGRLHAEAELERAKWREELMKAYGAREPHPVEQDRAGAESGRLSNASSALQSQLSRLLNDPEADLTFEGSLGQTPRVNSSSDPAGGNNASTRVFAVSTPFDAASDSSAPTTSPPQTGPAETPDTTSLVETLHKLQNPKATVDGPQNPVDNPDKTQNPVDNSQNPVDNPDKPQTPADDFDVRRALAQAAQEKVAALMLLSQQEERHEVEARQTLNLHARLGEAQARLAEVVQEKVAALLEVAELREEVLSLRDTER
jgi:hypothetical protein